MSNTPLKKDIKWGLLKFIETRIMIIFIGTICFAIFAERGHVYQGKSFHEIIDVRKTWNKFDSSWYQKLAKEGYPQRAFTDNAKETWGFMPLYPICLRSLGWLFGGNLFLAGIFISNACTLLALYIIYKLSQEKFKTGMETINLILICAGSFYLSIVYAEGLFVLLTALVFYLAHKKTYGWAFIIAGLASITRIQGCLLFVIPLIEIIRYHLRTCYRYLPAFVLSLLPMAAFMLYLNNTCGEPFAFIKIQHAWASTNLFPLQGFIYLLKINDIGSSLVNAFFWVLILGIVLSCYRKLPVSYLVFTVLYFLLSTSNEIIYGTTRYMLGILPLFIAVSLSSNYIKQFFIILNILFLAVTICAFVTNTGTFV